jgi:hypothetical protein
MLWKDTNVSEVRAAFIFTSLHPEDGAAGTSETVVSLWHHNSEDLNMNKSFLIS